MSQQHPQFQQQPYQPAPPKKPRRWVPWVTGGVVGLLAGLIIGTAGDATSVSSGPQPTVTVTAPNTGPSPDPVVTPTNKPTAPKPAATTTKPVPTKTAAPKPVVYKKLTAREWAKIAKSPDSHAGEAYIVYGVVTQFDSATGDEQFRADVDGVKHTPSYGYVDYPTNTLMTNISGDVSDLVEDDLFTAKVVVVGAFSYDTQIGGETTVPQLSVISISVTGNVK